MNARRSATIVVDLGFGDAGKGTVVDFLARRGAGWVIRFNGGAQAGHNVVTPDGRHHTFAQLGSGTFVPGVRTHLSRWMVVHPTALLVEAHHLARAGVPDALERLTISDRALVITPFHQAANRLRETVRGEGRVGTCGVGVGEAVADSLSSPAEALRIGDLLDSGRLISRLEGIREAKRAELSDVLRSLVGRPDVAHEVALFDGPSTSETWAEAVAPLRRPGLVVSDSFLGQVLRGDRPMVFEGAQGVLLDEWRGFHPHTTWSTCTFDNALGLLAEHGFDGEVQRLGVLRSYATRHGQGPFPTEALELTASMPEPHNQPGGWQGTFRVGWPDLLLMRYALACCGGVDALALTHLDRLRPTWRVCSSYRFPDAAPAGLFERRPDDPRSTAQLRLGAHTDLAFQTRLTDALFAATPEYRTLALGDEPHETYVKFLEQELGTHVALTSEGPTSESKRVRALLAW